MNNNMNMNPYSAAPVGVNNMQMNMNPLAQMQQLTNMAATASPLGGLAGNPLMQMPSVNVGNVMPGMNMNTMNMGTMGLPGFPAVGGAQFNSLGVQNAALASPNGLAGFNMNNLQVQQLQSLQQNQGNMQNNQQFNNNNNQGNSGKNQYPSNQNNQFPQQQNRMSHNFNNNNNNGSCNNNGQQQQQNQHNQQNGNTNNQYQNQNSNQQNGNNPNLSHQQISQFQNWMNNPNPMGMPPLFHQQNQMTPDQDATLSTDPSFTTIMLRNIPNKYTTKMLLAVVDKKFAKQYDYLYLPVDFVNHCNVGYAFVNLKTWQIRQKFAKTFHNQKVKDVLPGFNSKKVLKQMCEVNKAKVQGSKENIKRIKQMSMLMQRLREHPEWVPLTFEEDGTPLPLDLDAAQAEINARRNSLEQKLRGDSSFSNGQAQGVQGAQSVQNWDKPLGLVDLDGEGKGNVNAVTESDMNRVSTSCGRTGSSVLGANGVVSQRESVGSFGMTIPMEKDNNENDTLTEDHHRYSTAEEQASKAKETDEQEASEEKKDECNSKETDDTQNKDNTKPLINIVPTAASPVEFNSRDQETKSENNKDDVQERHLITPPLNNNSCSSTQKLSYHINGNLHSNLNTLQTTTAPPHTHHGQQMNSTITQTAQSDSSGDISSMKFSPSPNTANVKMNLMHLEDKQTQQTKATFSDDVDVRDDVQLQGSPSSECAAGGEKGEQTVVEKDIAEKESKDENDENTSKEEDNSSDTTVNPSTKGNTETKSTTDTSNQNNAQQVPYGRSLNRNNQISDRKQHYRNKQLQNQMYQQYKLQQMQSQQQRQLQQLYGQQQAAQQAQQNGQTVDASGSGGNGNGLGGNPFAGLNSMSSPADWAAAAAQLQQQQQVSNPTGSPTMQNNNIQNNSNNISQAAQQLAATQQLMQAMQLQQQLTNVATNPAALLLAQALTPGQSTLPSPRTGASNPAGQNNLQQQQQIAMYQNQIMQNMIGQLAAGGNVNNQAQTVASSPLDWSSAGNANSLMPSPGNDSWNNMGANQVADLSQQVNLAAAAGAIAASPLSSMNGFDGTGIASSPTDATAVAQMQLKAATDAYNVAMQGLAVNGQQQQQDNTGMQQYGMYAAGQDMTGQQGEQQY